MQTELIPQCYMTCPSCCMHSNATAFFSPQASAAKQLYRHVCVQTIQIKYWLWSLRTCVASLRTQTYFLLSLVSAENNASTSFFSAEPVTAQGGQINILRSRPCKDRRVGKRSKWAGEDLPLDTFKEKHDELLGVLRDDLVLAISASIIHRACIFFLVYQYTFYFRAGGWGRGRANRLEIATNR